MNCKTIAIMATLLVMQAAQVAQAGPFAPAAGAPGSTAVDANDARIVGWAHAVADYSPGSNVDTQFQQAIKATGPAGNSNGANEGYTFDTVSLGRNGSITLSFAQPIGNGNGDDFAVFENSFDDGFLELAWVEVSSNGVDFVRFSGISLTPGSVGAYSATMDPTDVNGFAGKYRAGYGTPFDLELVKNAANLDVNAVTHVRLLDIVGDGNTSDNLPPPGGPNPVYDPYPTSGSAGFDLDAIAVLNLAGVNSVNIPLPWPASLVLFGLLLSVYHLTQPIKKPSSLD